MFAYYFIHHKIDKANPDKPLSPQDFCTLVGDSHFLVLPGKFDQFSRKSYLGKSTYPGLFYSFFNQ